MPTYDTSMFEPKKKLDLSMFEDNSVDEMGMRTLDKSHDDIDWAHRTAVKNFGNNIDSSVKYLQEKYPHLEIKADGDRYKIRDPEKDNEWKRLDSSSLEWSDLTDVGYDVASGVAEGVATAGGFLGGGPLGAIGTAAVSGAAMEGGRQGIGRAIGVNEEVDFGDVAIAGGVSGAIPVAGKALRKAGSWAADKVGKHYPYLMSKMSGIDQDIIENVVADEKMYPTFKNDAGGYLRTTKNKLEDAVANKRDQAGKAIGDELDKIDDVQIDDLMDNLDAEIAMFKEQIDNSGVEGHVSFEALSKYEQLKKLRNELFERKQTRVDADGYVELDENGNEIVDRIRELPYLNARQAQYKAGVTKDLGNIGQDNATQSAVQRTINPDDKFALAKAREIGGEISGRMKDQMDNPQVYDDFMDVLDETKNIESMLKSKKDDSILEVLKQSRNDTVKGSVNKGRVDNLAEWAGENGDHELQKQLPHLARQAKSYDIFNNAKKSDMFSFNRNATPAAGAFATAGGLLGYGTTRSFVGGAIGTAAGAGFGNAVASPYAVKQTMKHAPAIRQGVSNLLDRSGDAGYGAAKSVWEMNRDQKRSTHQGF